MNKIRGMVVGVLLAVWCFPAVSSSQEPAPGAGAASGVGRDGHDGDGHDGGFVDGLGGGRSRQA